MVVCAAGMHLNVFEWLILDIVSCRLQVCLTPLKTTTAFALPFAVLLQNLHHFNISQMKENSLILLLHLRNTVTTFLVAHKVSMDATWWERALTSVSNLRLGFPRSCTWTRYFLTNLHDRTCRNSYTFRRFLLKKSATHRKLHK